jgi:hypothetical protein
MRVRLWEQKLEFPLQFRNVISMGQWEIITHVTEKASRETIKLIDDSHQFGESEHKFQKTLLFSIVS